MPMDKLVVINRALAATGNNELNVLNDGSAEWQVADRTFGRAVDDLISRHGWPFARVKEDLVPASDDDNPSEQYDHAYLLPADMVHVAKVRFDGAAVTDYEIIGRYLSLDYDTGVTVEGYAMPPDASWHPQAAEILTLYVEAGVLRGLNEDFSAADRREAVAESRLMEARPRVTRENPAQNAYVSTIATARRVRRG
jgi:hypothetical protein